MRGFQQQAEPGPSLRGWGSGEGCTAATPLCPLAACSHLARSGTGQLLLASWKRLGPESAGEHSERRSRSRWLLVLLTTCPRNALRRSAEGMAGAGLPWARDPAWGSGPSPPHGEKITGGSRDPTSLCSLRGDFILQLTLTFHRLLCFAIPLLMKPVKVHCSDAKYNKTVSYHMYHVPAGKLFININKLVVTFYMYYPPFKTGMVRKSLSTSSQGITGISNASLL